MNKLLIVAVMLLVTACSTNAPSPSNSAAVAISSSEPSPSPVHTIPNITSAPIANTASYQTFAQHLSTVSKTMKPLITAVEETAGNYDVAGVGIAATSLKGAITIETAWLDSNKPQLCYNALYSSWQNSMLNFNLSMSYLILYSNTLDTPAGNQGNYFMQQGTDELSRTLELLKIVNC
jgi:hypothetical protein